MAVLLLESRSRTVHHYDEEEKELKNDKNINEEAACAVSLTVWTKSLIFNCKGFTVIGSDGSLVYRVDNYSGRPDRIILMDASGNPIFTICRHKKLRIVENNWLVYEGEVSKKSIKYSSKKHVFCVRKNIISIIMKTTKPSVVAYVYCGGVSGKKGYVYMIEGSYEHRSCKILDESGRVVSEIKKKEALTMTGSSSSGGGVSFGLEVFDLIVKPGIDSRYAMAIVLILDQMFS